MSGTAGLVIAIGSVCVVALAAVIAKARVEIARIDARSGQRGGDVRR
ncbi:hypothetical protein OG978_32535 [Streptomyces sp. NBC_01591]|nr:hypothetical protein [Streptomyces sp. NBC_01591]WSD71702.1 hypothetical protein OG978_32535 [Streptomyces sp. NBC_01591]